MTDQQGDAPLGSDTQPQLDADPLLPTLIAPEDRDPSALISSRRQRADQIRQELNYDGSLTMAMLARLDELLHEPTPEEWRIDRAEDTGRATVPLDYQFMVMDDVLGRGHWTFLIHYTDGCSTARIFVLMGNHLDPDKVFVEEETGKLIRTGDAQILAWRASSGGIDSAKSKGILMSSTETVVLRRVLGLIGPGRDVLWGRQTQHAQTGATQRRATVVPLASYRPDRTAAAGVGEARAHELQVKLIASVIRGRKLPASQVANLIRQVAGQRAVDYRSEAEAQQFVDARLNDRRIDLAASVVEPLLLAIQNAEVAAPIAPEDGSPAPGAPVASADTVPFEPGGAEAA